MSSSRIENFIEKNLQKKPVKRIIFDTPLRAFFTYKHPFQFTVPQLCFLCRCIGEVREIKGALVEVGCFHGTTTVFLNDYMNNEKIDKKYYAIDTFSGFAREDIEHEVSKRQKNPSQYTSFLKSSFKNDKKWFDYTMNRNGIRRVISIQADVNKYDLTSLGALCFALLDVDLYRPTKKSLKELYEVLTPNGIIIVDDCDSKKATWGAAQAYKEFMQEINQPSQIVCDGLGIVRKYS